MTIFVIDFNRVRRRCVKNHEGKLDQTKTTLYNSNPKTGEWMNQACGDKKLSLTFIPKAELFIETLIRTE